MSSTPSRLGDFEIVEEIGRGGFGIVYRARQVSLDRPVAVKVLFRHLTGTEEQVSRFEREARAAARLDHPALVSVYAWGEAAEDFFIAQRLVGKGRTMADELADLRQAGESPKGHFRRMAEICARVAEGLQHAHARGIVHRDVKPSNILLDEAGAPCLGDFGLAKVEDGLELSRTGDMAGSPYYMSPEQADSRRGPVGPPSDVYSLGVTLYEMLTLTQPFKAGTSHELVRKILTEEPVRPSRIESRVPPDLETICLKAMEKQPALRYESAAAFAADLHAFLDGEPIAAVPISTTRRVLRAARRHREPVGLALLGLALVAGGWWATVKLSDSNRERETATRERDTEAVRAAIQERRAEDIGQLQEQGLQAIQEAAARGDEVTDLVRQQEAVKTFLDDTYRLVQNQVGELTDSSDVRDVAASLATGGLAGGLRSLQSKIAGRAVEGERDAVLSELERRMKLLDQHMAGGPTMPAAAPPAGQRVPSPLAALPRCLGAEGQAWLWLGAGVPLLLPLPADPLTAPVPTPGEARGGLADPALQPPPPEGGAARVPRQGLLGGGGPSPLRWPSLPR